MSGSSNARGMTAGRQIFEFVICLLVTVTLFRGWHVENFVVPSGSMAHALLGVHRAVTCRDCGFRFVCGSGEVDGFPYTEARAVCPNCDCQENPLGSLADIPGDRLLVSKQAFRLRPPRRWEMAVFRRPDVDEKVFVKRIAGLPGESIQIRGGDVYVDGVIQRKSLDQQRALAILVHDSQFIADSLGPEAERWHVDDASSLWRRREEGYFRPAAPLNRSTSEDGAAAIDWLSYRHLRRLPGQPSLVAESPIEDDYGYNQTRPVEDPAGVVDVMLSCQVRTFGRGMLMFFGTDGRERFVVRIDPLGHRAVLEHNQREVASATFPSSDGRPLFGRATLVELSLFDRQVLLAIDGQLAFPPYPIPPSDLPRSPTSRPLAIGSRGLGVDVRELRVYRDIYYTSPRGQMARWGIDQPYQLAGDEYFMLGDNSPLSEDSRYWPAGPSVRASLLVGRPLMVHLPSRQTDWGWGTFNVPDFSAIRYIR